MEELVMDKMDRDEKLWGGIFGIIAIVAAIAEMIINGIDTASVVGAIKDISGTLVVVVLLVAFIKSLPKKPKNFRELFEADMNEIEQAYAPLIVKYVPKDTAKDAAKAKNEKMIRYDILSSVDALFGKEQADHLRLFELNAEKPEKMCFYVREKFFGKPFDAKEVLARIKAVLRRSAPSERHEVREVSYDKLYINMENYEVRVDGKPVPTPPKEMELIYHLASHPNRVYTRDQLLDEVWGYEYFGDSRTVDVHIKRLREKLDGVSDQWELKTVWSVGYKFDLKE